MDPSASLAWRRRTGAAAAPAVLGAAILLCATGARAEIGDRGGAWILSPEINAPIGGRLTLAGLTGCDATMRYCLDFPLISFGVDITRPSSPHGKSISLAFAQAPLTGLAGLGALHSRSPTLKVAGLALAWLAGGMFRWSPGGEGNVNSQGGDSTTFSLVLKNEVALHPFVSRSYVRVTPGAGVAFSWAGRSGMLWTYYSCGAGGFASLAAEYGGASRWDPGVWLTCLLSGD